MMHHCVLNVSAADMRQVHVIQCSSLTNTSHDTLPSPGEFSVRLRDEGRPVPRVDAHERRRPEVSHLSHGRRGIRREESRLLLC